MAQEPAVPTRKYFVPLENNPQVMSDLLHNLGLSKKIAFHDVFSIDEPELLNFIPRPAHAVLLVFPTNDTYHKHREEEDRFRSEYAGSGPDEPVMWYKQTIGNACGLIGLLHGVSNGQAKHHIDTGSDLAKLLQQAIPLRPAQRADLLYNSSALEAAHGDAAQQGDSVAPDAHDRIDLHYVCFVKGDDGYLWELDGARKGPLQRGTLTADQDVLSEQALDLGPRPFLKREEEAASRELRFSIIALAPNWD